MALINPDYTEALQTLKPGIYPARIRSCTQKISKAENQYLEWTLDVTVGDRAITMFHRTPFTGKGAGMFRDLVRAAFDPNYENGSINTDVLVGCALDVRLDFESNPDGSVGKFLRVKEVLRANPAFGDFGT